MTAPKIIGSCLYCGGAFTLPQWREHVAWHTARYYAGDNT